MTEDKVTPEQRKAVGKILSKSRWSMLFASIKFFLGMLGLNFLTSVFTIYYLKDSSAESQHTLTAIFFAINFIFMAIYYNGQMKAISDKVNDKVKEILNNQTDGNNK